MGLHNPTLFREENVLHHLKHFLPAQAPLKDFIHHNTLHAFQDKTFFHAIGEARTVFGYKTSLSVREYRSLYLEKKIDESILDRTLGRHFEKADIPVWKEKMLRQSFNEDFTGRIGQLRSNWKRLYSVDPDLEIQPFLFRLLCNYLDQGIAIWRFPIWDKSFLTAIREMEKNSMTGFFKTARARQMLLDSHNEISDLLKILVGEETLYEHYLFDQQFAHPGWSGMISVLEDMPQSLLDNRQVSLRELIILELLLEIDVLDHKFGENWIPLGYQPGLKVQPLFAPVTLTDYDRVIQLWQESFEWSFFDQVLGGIVTGRENKKTEEPAVFQALFCIDDRECSFRRYVEEVEPKAKTFGTPGFFGAAFYYKPMDGKFTMKVCPAPLNPGYLIKEQNDNKTSSKDFHFEDYTHSLFFGWLITHTLGLWSAIRLFINIFIPRLSPATSLSFRHMDRFSKLSIENQHPDDKEDGLQVGFTQDEMTDRVEGLLKSIGLVDEFAPIIYVVGHGATSVNNTHYAGYDCGACSGRPGSVNARVICYMANHPAVREKLKDRGLVIPPKTVFMGALHDTTRDEIEFFDDSFTDTHLTSLHDRNKSVFKRALVLNASERARRFVNISRHLKPNVIHEKVKRRSVSLFEPRPELNHATNALCIVGRREMTDHLFLDRRAFMNSYDYRNDPDGKYLFGILSAAAPVCGGINLEYYFSRVDNHKLGAGTKLPHNVMGLIGVTNGIDGDLRTGLPEQMIEVHDPLRLLIIVEHFEETVAKTIRSNETLFEWFKNEWVQLAVYHPVNKTFSRFLDGAFVPYHPENIPRKVSDLPTLLQTRRDNLPVYLLND